jgi:DUF1009 family protein
MNVRADSINTKLAIIAGRGDLPRLLAEECRASGREYIVVEFEHIPLDWANSHPVIPAIFEQPGRLFTQLHDISCVKVVMAGAMARAPIDIGRLDEKGQELATILAKTAKAGDDKTLVSIIKFFEDNLFTVVAAHEVLDKLIPKFGVLTKLVPSEADKFDAKRAAEIVDLLGRADVGQGVVVAQGICLGLESIQGTDRMLAFVGSTRDDFSHEANGGRGILLKAPKPKQDLRVDLPAIGPNTVQNAYDAGLSGIAVESGGVMILNQNETVALADELELFLWVRPKE